VFGISFPAQDFQFIVTNSHSAFLTRAFLRLVSVPKVGVDPLCSSIGQQYFSVATPPSVLGGLGLEPFVLLPSGHGVMVDVVPC